MNLDYSFWQNYVTNWQNNGLIDRLQSSGIITDEGREALYRDWGQQNFISSLWGFIVIQALQNREIGEEDAYELLSQLASIQLYGLRQLTHLDLARNQFSQELPTGWTSATGLNHLDLSGNTFTGQLPNNINQVTQLAYLHLGENSFSGNVPATIGQLSYLTYLNLSTNTFTGTILEKIYSCTRLREAWLDNNQFSGSFGHQYLPYPTALRILSASHNQLTGTLPGTLREFNVLERLDVSHNQLTGSLPEGWGSWTSLRWLNLGYNRLMGAVPQDIAAMPNLTTFWVMNNKLTSVPDFSTNPRRTALNVDVSRNAICYGPLEANASGPGQFLLGSYRYQLQENPFQEVTETQSVDESIVLTCSFSGTQNAYQWHKRDAAGVWQSVMGATNAVFRIDHPTLADAGRYACQVTNGWLSAWASPALYLWTQTTNLVLTASTVAAVPIEPSPTFNDRNWTVERTYDGVDNTPGNVLSEGIQFTDGLGRATQAQAKSRATPHVFASQTLYSTGGQPVLQTLAAPTNNQRFAYKESFITPAGQTAPYGPTNFEESKASNPDAIANTAIGTLGYYFSTNNALEPYTPITEVPYSLTEPAEGPLGGTRRAASPGDAFRMGQGREARGWELPLLKEFDHYMQLRHHFVPGSSNLTTLQRQGVKSVSVDADGRETVVVANKEGQALVSCLTGSQYPGTEVQAFISTDPTNTYDPTAPSFLDIHIPAAGEHRLDFTLGGQVRVESLNGAGGVSLSSGAGYQLSRDITVNPNGTSGAQSTPVYLQPGFYRLTSLPPANATNTSERTQWFTYQVEYGNFSYTYYDDAGRVVATVAPNGLPGASGSNGVRNPSFEQDNSFTRALSGWEIDPSSTAGVTIVEAYGGAHTGTYHGTHYSYGPYYAFTHQIVTNLPNGLYTLRAWVKGSGGQTKAFMLTRQHGSTLLETVTIPATPGGTHGDWVAVEIKDIAVSNNQCDIGFESESSGNNHFIYFDDVTFARQPDASLPEFVTRNTYDTSGRLLATESTDEGRTEYVYARDGRIRFSQSALQRPAGRFSYSSYDAVGRVVESGEYTPAGAGATTFQSQLPFSNKIEAESGSRTGGAQVITSPTMGYVGYITTPGSGVTLNFTVPTRGTYSLRIRYATPGTDTRSMATYLYPVRNGASSPYIGHTTFPGTASWERWEIRTIELELAQGANSLTLQQDQPTNGTNSEGNVNLDYIEVISEQIPTSTSVLNLLEERAPANSLLAAHCAQRNFVTYDEAATVAGRQQEFTLGAVSRTRNDQVTTHYSYDELGRVTWVVQQIANLGRKTLDYKYDFAGNVLEVAYQHGQPDAFHHYYEYDQAQRLYKVYTSPDGTERTLQAKYFYYLHGPLKRVELANRLQGLDYVYTLQGQLKSLNHVNQTLDPGADSPQRNDVPKDLFGLTFDYFANDYQSRAQAAVNPAGISGAGNPFRYDGTIRAAAWRTAASPDKHQVVYAYDAKSQLAQSEYGKLTTTNSLAQFTKDANSGFQEGGLSYDANGNMQSLRRTNKLGAVIDNFSYQYTPGTNRLNAIHGNGSATGPVALEYEYDALGQMTREIDGTSEKRFKYDVTGKVTEVRTANNRPVSLITYDDKGFRLSKTTHDDNGDTENTTTYVRDVAGNVLAIYESNYGNAYTPTRTEVPLYGSGRVGTLTRLDQTTEDYRYELNDHLGDARVVFHQPTTTITTASCELGTAYQQEDSQWQGLAQNRVHRGNGAHQGITTPSNYTVQLPALVVNNERVAVRRSFSVQKGDTLTFSAYAFVIDGGVVAGGNNRPHLTPIVSPMQAARAANTENTTSNSNWLSRLSGGIALTGWGGNRDQQRAALGAARVWIRFHFVPDDPNSPSPPDEYAYDDGRYSATYHSWYLLRNGLRVPEQGTLEVSVGSNDPALQGYFDDLRLEHTGGLIVQEQHQYAYGSPLTGLNYVVGNKRYRHGYQGQYAEQDPETGYESFELRLYNARIGRWTSYDPYGQFSSPYVGMGNNPVSSTDPDGGFSKFGAVVGAAIGAGVGYAVTGDWKGAVAGGVLGAVGGGLFGPELKSSRLYGMAGKKRLSLDWSSSLLHSHTKFTGLLYGRVKDITGPSTGALIGRIAAKTFIEKVAFEVFVDSNSPILPAINVDTYRNGILVNNDNGIATTVGTYTPTHSEQTSGVVSLVPPIGGPTTDLNVPIRIILDVKNMPFRRVHELNGVYHTILQRETETNRRIRANNQRKRAGKPQIKYNSIDEW